MAQKLCEPKRGFAKSTQEVVSKAVSSFTKLQAHRVNVELLLLSITHQLRSKPRPHGLRSFAKPNETSQNRHKKLHRISSIYLDATSRAGPAKPCQASQSSQAHRVNVECATTGCSPSIKARSPSPWTQKLCEADHGLAKSSQEVVSN